MLTKHLGLFLHTSHTMMLETAVYSPPSTQEVQRGQGTFSRPHSWTEAETGLWLWYYNITEGSSYSASLPFLLPSFIILLLPFSLISSFLLYFLLLKPEDSRESWTISLEKEMKLLWTAPYSSPGGLCRDHRQEASLEEMSNSWRLIP